MWYKNTLLYYFRNCSPLQHFWGNIVITLIYNSIFGFKTNFPLLDKEIQYFMHLNFPCNRYLLVHQMRLERSRRRKKSKIDL